ncbi:MAG: hypothetical protein LLG01_00830 [Planctomycetaceae bacterium]|nr:hypothetical protein [Planctomycetaceae bacterium]
MLTFETLREGTELGTTAGTSLVVVQCWCGLWHAIPADLHRMAKDNKHEVFCPVGHKWYYAESEADRLKKEKEKLEAIIRAKNDLLAVERARHDQTRASLRAQRGVTTRILNRTHNGVCPHCKRHFENLHRHMQTKHGIEK